MIRPLLSGALLGSLLLLSGCSGLFYWPDRILYSRPERVGFSAQEIVFTAADGVKLDGWYIPARRRDPSLKIEGPSRPPLGTIIQFHGNAENISSHYLSLVWLADYGYNVFTFDYRGYGRSQSSPDQSGTHRDAMAALSKAWELHQNSGAANEFIVYGQSLGGAIAMRALEDFPHRDQVSLIVMDSTFVSYQRIAHEKMARIWFTWPIQWLAPVLVSDEYSAEDALKKSRTSLLVIHDHRDPAVPYDLGELTYRESVSPRKEFWTLDQGYHIGIFVDPAYRHLFVDFLRASDAPVSE
ncbi:MAG: alpha/beta hydrolase [Oligoflexia bacterium]|nr:alpha/beta hydrolase [Oligoflexia bacterium]